MCEFSGISIQGLFPMKESIHQIVTAILIIRNTVSLVTMLSAQDVLPKSGLMGLKCYEVTPSLYSLAHSSCLLIASLLSRQSK